jgi:hypothetical protein
MRRHSSADGAVLLATSAAGGDQISRTELSLRLRNDLAVLEAPIRLAQRGKACCPFFGFTILIGADDLALHVSVPGEASWLLSEFARSAPALTPEFLVNTACSARLPAQLGWTSVAAPEAGA